MDQTVIIPAIDPSSRLISLHSELRMMGFTRFVVVDDGSGQDSLYIFDILEARGAIVVHHPENLGKGEAIKTGIQTAITAYPESPACVTVDCDGQHLPKDVRGVCLHAQAHPDALVLGQRSLHDTRVPLRSRLGNTFSSLYFKLDTGMSLGDTQTGLRVIPRCLYQLALETEGARYDCEMNFLSTVVKRNCEVRTVAISTVYYADNNQTSHFDTVRDSLLIFGTPLRFTLASMTCAAVDLGLFALLTSFINMDIALLVLLATVTARVASGVVNFALNRRWSFRATEGRTSKQARRYAVLFVCLMFASAGLVTAFSASPIPLVAVKVLVDGCLFFISYYVQHNWVFVDHDAEMPIMDTVAAQTHTAHPEGAVLATGTHNVDIRCDTSQTVRQAL